MFQRSARLLVSLALLLGLTACSSDSGGGETSTSVEPPQGLRRSLLTVQDLPAGWTLGESVSPASGNQAENGFCNKPVPDTQKASGWEAAQFTKTEGTTQLAQSVVSYSSPEDAIAAFDQVAETVRTCKQWNLELNDSFSSYVLGAFDVPNFSDQTLAVKISGDFRVARNAPAVQGFVVADGVVIRHQNLITVIRHFTIGVPQPLPVNSEETQSIARSAAGKLKVSAVGP